MNNITRGYPKIILFFFIVKQLLKGGKSLKKKWSLITLIMTFFVTGVMALASAHTAHTSHTADATKQEECDCKKCVCEKCKCEKCECEKCPGKSLNPYQDIMDRMMVDMDKVSKDTNMEINFLEQMSIHHNGAVEMADYQIENGKDSELIQLSKAILAEQKSEIQEMTHLISLQKDSKNRITEDYLNRMYKTMEDMMKNTPITPSENLDIAFVELMIPHHQASIDMAMALISLNPNLQVLNYSKKIISDQQIEINQMREYQNKHKN